LDLNRDLNHFSEIFIYTDDRCSNLTYKGVAALKWISTHCSEATYVIKVDDDIFVNMFTVVKHLKDLYTTSQRSRIIMCTVRSTGRVHRRGKWGVPRRIVPQRFYPVYCSGLFAIMSADVVRAAYRASYYVRFFWLEDVYITGRLMEAMRHSTRSLGENRGVAEGGQSEVGVSSGSRFVADRPIAVVGVEVGDTSDVGGRKGVAKGEVVGAENDSKPAVRYFDMRAVVCNQTEMAVLYTHRTEWYKYAFTHVHDGQLFWSTWSALCQVAERSAIPTPSVIRPGVLADDYQPLRSIFPDIELRWQRWSQRERRRIRREYFNLRIKRKDYYSPQSHQTIPAPTVHRHRPKKILSKD